jgi:hypothetical protein
MLNYNFINLYLLSLSSYLFGQGVVNPVYILKEQIICFIDPLHYSISFNFSSDSSYFFTSTNFGIDFFSNDI